MTNDEMLADMIRRSEQEQPIIERLVHEGVHPITAHIMAGDILSAQRATEMVAKGTPVEKAYFLVGSYARWDWTVAMLVAGKVSEQWFADHICDLWSGSDPDDTSEQNLRLWRRFWARNGGATIRDGKALTRARSSSTGLVKVYRGGMPGDLTNGFAWTTDPKIAQKFALGAGTRVRIEGGVVVSGQVRPGQVLAYITGRGEAEVIVDPHLVSHVKVVGAK